MGRLRPRLSSRLHLALAQDAVGLPVVQSGVGVRRRRELVPTITTPVCMSISWHVVGGTWVCECARRACASRARARACVCACVACSARGQTLRLLPFRRVAGLPRSRRSQLVRCEHSNPHPETGSSLLARFADWRCWCAPSVFLQMAVWIERRERAHLLRGRAVALSRASIAAFHMQRTALVGTAFGACRRASQPARLRFHAPGSCLHASLS